MIWKKGTISIVVGRIKVVPYIQIFISLLVFTKLLYANQTSRSSSGLMK